MGPIIPDEIRSSIGLIVFVIGWGGIIRNIIMFSTRARDIPNDTSGKYFFMGSLDSFL